MEVDFVKMSPTRNMTILVTTPLNRADYRELAEKIMAYDNVHAEQVGFLETPVNPQALARLQMAGGEFCGNASLSLCAYLVWKGKASCQHECTIPIESSGSDGLLYCTIRKSKDHFLGKINMPVPEIIRDCNAEINGRNYHFPVVYMPGISHVIVNTDKIDLSEEIIVDALLCNLEAITDEDAFGVMFYNEQDCCLKPFVYVKTAGTKVWERGCGSGTASLGAYLAYTSGKDIKADIPQPGGIITVEAAVADKKITSITIEGKIRIVAEGKAYI